MGYVVFARTLRTPLVLAVVLAAATRVTAAPFTDHLVQAPKLAPPGRGSVAGALANLAFQPGSMSRGTFTLPIPVALPSERGEPLVNPLPSYSPEGEQSEWGMGWRVDLSIRRIATIGDIDMSGDEFASPWGRLTRGDDDRYYVTGNPSQISIRRVNDEWQAVDRRGTTYLFTAADLVAGGYAWMLSRVDSVLGETTTFTYERNASGRPFVSSIEWGGRGSVRQYRLGLAYDAISVPLDDYHAGSKLTLDRRVREVRIAARSAVTGEFEIGSTYQLEYTPSPAGAAFYLTGVTRSYRSGEREPTQRYEYDSGNGTLATAALIDVPALGPVLASKGGTSLQPDKATQFDIDEDGAVDFEIAEDQMLVRLRDGVFSMEALPANPARLALCRPSPATSNPPRVLARMTPEATEPQVVRSIVNAVTGKTRLLVCDRQGVPLHDQEIPGAWQLGPNTHLVDLNHDHRPDLIRMFAGGYQVLENTSGPDGFSFIAHPRGTLGGGFTLGSNWLHDMNGDGQADLVMRLPSSIAVWYGLGQFRFTESISTLPLEAVSGVIVTNLAQRQLTFLDVNHDGLTDVLTTQGRVLNLFINHGRKLKEIVVPGFASIAFDFGAPVIADVPGRGNFAAFVVQGVHAKAIELSSAATGLLVAAHDGRGTDIAFAYKRAAVAAGIGHRTSVLDSITIASSGYDAVAHSYDYGAPVLHTVGRHLIGFTSADKRSPTVTEHVEFLNDDDVSGVHIVSEDRDDRTPGMIRFTYKHYDEATFHGARWLRPSIIETGSRSADGRLTLSTTTQYAAYEREFCPTVVSTTSPSGQLISTSRLASVPAIPDELHCLPAGQDLFGMHAEPSLDFHYMVDLARSDVGQITRVTQFGPAMQPLVLQDVTYDPDHRTDSLGMPGRGITSVSYDALGRLSAIIDPLGIVTQIGELDPVTDAVLELETSRPNAASTAYFHYDGKERLQASWDDVSGASETSPLARYGYQDATSTTPGRIDVQTLADAVTGVSRRSVELVGADGATLVAGTWLGDHFSLGAASITFRNSLTTRRSFIGTMSEAALSATTSDDLRALGTPLAETVAAGFGHAIAATTTQQVGVVGTVTTELVLGPSELATRVHQPGGFTAESAVDAAGRLVRKLDENGVTHRYRHDVLGRIVAVETPDGWHTLAFDGFGRPATVTREGIGSIVYVYDAVTGLPTRKQRLDASGAVIDTSDTLYDTAGRPIQVAQTASKDASELSFDYDGQLGQATAAGQLGRLTRVRGEGWDRTALFDPLGRAYEQHTTLTGWRELTCDKTFRADGSVARDTLTIADPLGNVTFSSTKETVLDGLGRVSALTVDGAVLYTLSYDDEGRLERADFTSGESITFDFDPVTHQRRGHQISAPDVSGGVHWDRDPRGLISAETYDRGTSTTRRDYTYDGRGALLRSTSPDENSLYTYTASSLPATISDATGSRSVHRTGSTLVVGDDTYRWDSAGRLVGKSEWTFEYGASGQLTHASRPGRAIDYVYDDGNQRLLKRVDGVPVRAEVYGGVLTEDHFVELVTVGGVVAGVLDNGQFTALLTDPRGTPFAGPDGSASMATPYGVRASHSALSEVIDYARLGWDPDLEVVRMGVRDYDPKLGQFLTPDPLFFEDLEKCQGSPVQCTLYGYAGGNPISFVDPTGLGFWRDFLADFVEAAATAVGASVGAFGGGPLGAVAGAGLASGIISAPADWIRGETPTVMRQLTAVPVGATAAAGGAVLAKAVTASAAKVLTKRAESEAAQSAAVSTSRALAEIDRGTALSAARTARDTRASELGALRPPARPAAVTAGYNVDTGEIAVGCSGGGVCAEARVVQQLGGDASKVRFTEAVRPRPVGPPLAQVPVCHICQANYGREPFPAGTLFKK